MMKKIKNGILLFMGMSILCLPGFLMVRTFAVIWTGEVTVPHKLANACHHPSPNGRFCGAAIAQQGVKVSDEDGHILFNGWGEWSHFIGWTDDSRFAFYNLSDQYGENRRAVMFDTNRWEIIFLGEDGDMSSKCRKNVIALAPQNNLILQEGGCLYDLNHQTKQNIFPNLEASWLAAASWSPNENYLALLGNTDNQTGEVMLFVTERYGENVTPIPEFTFSANELYTPNLHWIENNTIQFEDNNGTRYEYQIER